MAYQIISKDRGIANPIIVEDGTVNKETAVSLVGKDYFGYGTDTAQNFVSLLENFATAEPALSKRIKGMTWYDTSSQTFKIWNGVTWLGTSFNQRTVLDNATILHDVFVSTGDGEIVSVHSSESFVLHVSETELLAAMPTTTIHTGITLASNMNLHGAATALVVGVTPRVGSVDTAGTGTANTVAVRDGSGNLNAVLFQGTATSALYADLAELYTSDVAYAPGTIIKLGGGAEVTQTTSALDENVFGIVSTNPAYLMNSVVEGTSVAVALVGRVPCNVIGEVRKGQRLVSSETPGVARAASEHEFVGLDWFTVIGRALEDKNTLGVGSIEVVVGTK